MINKEYSEAWNKVAPPDEEDGFDVSKFEPKSEEPIKLAGNGLSFQTNTALKRLEMEQRPAKEPESPAISKIYARPPGVQKMNDEQASKLQELQRTRAEDRKVLLEGKRVR